jgi:hypothetical protein
MWFKYQSMLYSTKCQKSDYDSIKFAKFFTTQTSVSRDTIVCSVLLFCVFFFLTLFVTFRQLDKTAVPFPYILAVNSLSNRQNYNDIGHEKLS